MPTGIYKHKKGYWLGKKRPPFSKNWKENISKARVGKSWGYHHSKKTREKIKKSHLGKKQPKISEAKMGKPRPDMLGEKHFNWKGGISKDIHSPKEPKYKKWRVEVFTRDNWTCQTCGIRSKAGEPVYLEPHHLKGWAKFPELRYDILNGITLCKECHKLTDNYGGKK